MTGLLGTRLHLVNNAKTPRLIFSYFHIVKSLLLRYFFKKNVKKNTFFIAVDGRDDESDLHEPKQREKKRTR